MALRLLEKLKYKIRKKQVENLFDWNLKLYKFKKGNRTIYSNSHEHFQSYFKKIFVDEIYKFESENKSPFIVDCGSNIGLAIRYWKELFPLCEIIGFEPDPFVFRALEKNCESLNGVKLFKLALSNTEKIVEFSSNGKLSGSLNLSKNLPNKIKVKTDKLSKYISGKQVDLLKIDIEGEEVIVLQEIAPLLNNINLIFVEYHSFLGQNQELSKLTKILEDNGFRYYIESESIRTAPFLENNTILNQDLQINIWAKKYDKN